MTSKYIVAVGGTLRNGSSTEAAMRRVLHHAAQRGARIELFSGSAIDLPMYAPGNVAQTEQVGALLAALRKADAVIFGSPGYHGGVSGLVKNAIDYTEEMARDARPYLSGKPVGCIGSGAGYQGCNATLSALRGIVHALRGWPTPLGIAFNSAGKVFDPDGNCLVSALEDQFRIMADELIDFGGLR